MFKKVLSLFILLSISILAKSQDQTGQFIKVGVADANLLSKAYLKPLFNGFGVGFNQGWASRADVRLGRVDLKFLGGLSFVPPSDQVFDATQLGLSSNVKVNGSGISPTVSGSNSPGARFDIYANNPITGNPQNISSINSPNGTGINFIPVIIPQITVGLPFSTEIGVRAIPNIQIGKAQIGVFGGALKHDIASHIPLLPFHLSVLGGFTQTNLHYGLDVQPDPGASPNPGSDYSNQKLNLKSNSLTLGIMASKTLAVLTVHLGANYNHSSGILTATGTYPITTYSVAGTPQTTDIKDPINISSDALSYVSATAGFQLKFAFFSLLGEGTVGKYNSVNAGLGFSF